MSAFGGRLARDLPSSGNAWSLPETAEPAAIVDRIDGAGPYLGEPGRFSMRARGLVDPEYGAAGRSRALDF